MDHHHGVDEHQHHLRQKLTFIKSPIAAQHHHHHHHSEDPHSNDLPNLEEYGERDTPNLQRHDDASTLETFFDLFFAANYTVFTHSQSVTNVSRFKAYVGYFCLLWLTWFTTTLYDVRFVTDSVFERAARACQLGVLVGFAVVAPSFDPDHQHIPTMRTMSVILSVSRAVLAIEYGTILWHCRNYKKTRIPLWISVAMNAAASAIYLGITFRFHEKRSRIFMTWYFISGFEAIGTLVLSNFYEFLSFTQTHLGKRMLLLTILILGDGVISIAENIVEIVEKPEHWNPTIIGIVTAATATVYFVFLIYFDWMRIHNLPPWRLQLWSLLHLPFHLALVVFMAGFEQLIVWSKIVETFNHLGGNWILWDKPALLKTTSLQVSKNITDVTTQFFSIFPPKDPEMSMAVHEAIVNITTLPDALWSRLAKFEENNDASVFGNTTSAAKDLYEIVTVILSSMSNSVFESFEIEAEEGSWGSASEGSDVSPISPDASGQFQVQVQAKTWQRYRLVFAYGYIAAGSALILMTMLSIVSRNTPWKPWPAIRAGIYVALGFAVGVVALLFYHPAQALDFLFSPWVLPTVTFLWFIVLILTHIGSTTAFFFNKGDIDRPRGMSAGAGGSRILGTMRPRNLLYRNKTVDRGGDAYVRVDEPGMAGSDPWNEVEMAQKGH
ncbi:hypothetical protein ESCO_004011 [Escovopsis weberi]|uniref:Low temperature requirement A n=1 Tax=Escovopsis weberi TaxID=150374 RepID=A0A0M8NA46_ESCWE|nr:hypothetical protein ESCO_004011 [Escovopsis weberi]